MAHTMEHAILRKTGMEITIAKKSLHGRNSLIVLMVFCATA